MVWKAVTITITNYWEQMNREGCCNRRGITLGGRMYVNSHVRYAYRNLALGIRDVA